MKIHSGVIYTEGDEIYYKVRGAGNGTKLYIGCSRYGMERNAWYAKAAQIIAEKLSCEVLEFPGHHGSFMDRPAEWAEVIREITYRSDW